MRKTLKEKRLQYLHKKLNKLDFKQKEYETKHAFMKRCNFPYYDDRLIKCSNMVCKNLFKRNMCKYKILLLEEK